MPPQAVKVLLKQDDLSVLFLDKIFEYFSRNDDVLLALAQHPKISDELLEKLIKCRVSSVQQYLVEKLTNSVYFLEKIAEYGHLKIKLYLANSPTPIPL